MCRAGVNMKIIHIPLTIHFLFMDCVGRDTPGPDGVSVMGLVGVVGVTHVLSSLILHAIRMNLISRHLAIPGR